MTNNKLILWDIDGTLMHCGSNGTLALNKAFREIYGIDDAFGKAGIGRAMDAVILDTILAAFQIVNADKTEILSVYIRHLEEILRNNSSKKVMPGVLELLEHIDKHPALFNGLLTSNFRQGATVKLQAVDLLNYFTVGGFGDLDGEKWDAALRGVADAERHFKVAFRTEDVYIIGDSAYDIECARKLGMKSIGVATGWTDYETLQTERPDHLFHDLSDYPAIMKIFGSIE